MPVASFGIPGVAEMPGEVVLMRIDLDQPLGRPAWPAGVRVRTFRPEDAADVHELLVAAFAYSSETIPPYREWLETMTGDPEFDPTVWFLAVESDDVVGVALAWDDGFLKDLAVHPRARGRGVGEALLLHTFDAFARRGVGHVSLKVRAGNHAARRLYERAGMTEVDRTA
jgi:ribosomal protein S18 acetylase RimI-like enzyme